MHLTLLLLLNTLAPLFAPLQPLASTPDTLQPLWLEQRWYNGIDISHHNHVNWKSVQTDTAITFCYIKASEGVHFLDSMASSHYLSARKLGLHTGFYHYFRYNVSGRLQFERFNSVLKRCHNFDLKPVVDVERTANDNFCDTALLNRNLEEFTACFRRYYGYTPILYFCDTVAIHRIIRHPSTYQQWIPRWRMTSVSSLPDLCQMFVRRLGGIPIDFDYCPNLQLILAPNRFMGRSILYFNTLPAIQGWKYPPQPFPYWQGSPLLPLAEQ
ncbi:MAG: glycoside hydrolase family 25 protein [Bacteroidales bacterium]|nr:glycoside hydrolase family 25 protein [Bacteroidales bacterium]